MNAIKRVSIISITITIILLLEACGIATPIPTSTATVTSAPLLILSITPSPIPSVIPLPTNTYTATPEPDVAPNCKTANEAGQLYLLSDREFHDLRTHDGILNEALAAHYPEWASYTQMVPSSTQPVNLGEIMQAVSLDEEANLQINPAVTLVTLGESLDWQLPSNTDLYLKSQEISTELNRLSFDWENPFDDSLRSQYPEVANSGTYALYAYFNYDLVQLQNWCNIYQQLFETPP